MGKPKEIGFWDGTPPYLKPACLTLLVAVGGWNLYHYITASHPNTASTTTQNRTEQAQIRKNIVRETQETKPDGTTLKTRLIDLSTTDSLTLDSLVSQSLSSLPLARQYGLSVAYDPFKQEWWGGGVYGLTPFLEVGIRSNVKDRLLLEGIIKF